MTTQQEKCKSFAALHQSENAWVIPNPWDIGSAKVLEGIGFKALATTSGGFAFTQGRIDGAITLEQSLRHCSELTRATSLPISADFENGFSDDIAQMVSNIERLAETGVAGFSIEDFSRDKQVIYPVAQAVERIQAAVEAIKKTGVPLVLTARAESLLRGFDDYEEVIERLLAFEAAGADVLFAPGIRQLDQLQLVTRELHKPFNVLASFLRGTSVTELAAAGAQRISVGGALTYAVVQALVVAGREMLEQGTFNWLADAADAIEIRKMMDKS